MPNHLERLNPPQLEAATHWEGPLMVLAGAGSGKTRMLTARIQELIYSGRAKPHEILAMTFTNKAAGEMRARTGHEFGVEIGTFHSVCVRILRREMAALPFTKPFVIYDDSDQLSLIKSTLSLLNLDSKQYSPKSVQATINRYKCDAVEPEHAQEQNAKPGSHLRSIQKVIADVYSQYQKALIANNALDFGEIICLTYRMLRDNEMIRKRYQERFRFVHVDEYQDTNRSQYLLLSTLCGKPFDGHQNICVVGDEDQSIYRWRGADIRNILEFERDFPGATIVKLEENYRSTQTIIKAASELIAHNTLRKPKTLWTNNEEGSPILRFQAPDDRAEAEWVIREISRLCSEDSFALDDFAIFYRTHAQSRQFEDILRREKLPYQIVGGLRFYDRKEVKDIFAFLRLLLNPQDSVSLKRVINVPARGIGASTIEKLESANQLGNLIETWQHSALDLSSRTSQKISHFVMMMKRLQSLVGQIKLSEIYHRLLDETGYILHLKQEGTVESLDRIDTLQELDHVILEFEETALKTLGLNELLPRFLEQTSLASTEEQGNPGPTIKMMSLHASKGLEFPVVFLTGLEDGLFPSVSPWEAEDPDELEEERRLCYVGMTRAEKKLYLSHAHMRRVWGEVQIQKPSRFFKEFDQSRVVRQGTPDAPRPLSINTSPRLQEDFQDSVIGASLRHPSYGLGRIVASEGGGDHKKVTIEFSGKVQKKFLIQYVKPYFI